PKVSCECQSHLGRILVDEVYPLTTKQLFTILFSSNPWYHHLEEIVSRTGYIATSWMTESPTVTTRTVTYNMALNNALGPKSTSVTEKQTCYTFRGAVDGFSVMKEIQNAGIPCADSFIIQCTYCVIRAGNTHSRLLIHGTMIQKKSIWGIVKGIIEKSTYSGLETHYTVLMEALKLLCEGSAEAKQSAVSTESEETGSIISNFLPNKLLNGYANIDISFLSAKLVGVSKCTKNK
uniref:VASt domain-containing protein n=1 Tax=Elaeophora elaphi TaxID=1147741 RepID=A0A0R3RN76_9BILA